MTDDWDVPLVTSLQSSIFTLLSLAPSSFQFCVKSRLSQTCSVLLQDLRSSAPLLLLSFCPSVPSQAHFGGSSLFYVEFSCPVLIRVSGLDGSQWSSKVLLQSQYLRSVHCSVKRQIEIIGRKHESRGALYITVTVS